MQESIDTPTARRRLKPRQKAYYDQIDRGVSLGYRRGKGRPVGRWRVRVYLGDKQYVKKSLGLADDVDAADGITTLDYYQAADLAREIAKVVTKGERTTLRPVTVDDAMRDYLDWLSVHKKSADTAEMNYKAHIKPKLGRKTIAALTAPVIRRWHADLASAPARIRGKDAVRPLDTKDPEAMRRRKSTANRILTVLKAGLNYAFRDGVVDDDTAWRRVTPFPNVDAPRVRFLSVPEAKRLVNAASPDLRKLMRGALLSGARYGELTALRVEDYDPAAGTIYIRDSKSGKPRHIPLNEEGQGFFEEVSAGRTHDDILFLRENDTPWGKSQQSRPLKEAAAKAKLKDVSFHVLRHTYGSFLAAKGVPLQVIASALGHADTRTTEKHYAHLQPDHVALAIRANLPKMYNERPKVRQLR